MQKLTQNPTLGKRFIPFTSLVRTNVMRFGVTVSVNCCVEHPGGSLMNDHEVALEN